MSGGEADMNMPKHLNAAIAYIESNLCAEFDLEEAARLACVTSDSFLRFFSYMTGMSLNEYIRRRRLTLAGADIRKTSDRILDIAVKYGYDSADAFTRAFVKQHGMTPTAYRKNGGSLKVYPPASFHIIIKGAKEMDFRIIELEDTAVFGVSKQFDGMGYQSIGELRNIMWSEAYEDVPHQICNGRWDEPDSTAYDGIWYGIRHDGKYLIAREKDDIQNEDLEVFTIPKGTYAAFKTERGGFAWEEFPKLFSLIFESWLPTSEYQQKGDLAIEVLHLWTDRDLRHKNRYYEVWIPVEPKA